MGVLAPGAGVEERAGVRAGRGMPSLVLAVEEPPITTAAPAPKSVKAGGERGVVVDATEEASGSERAHDVRARPGGKEKEKRAGEGVEGVTPTSCNAERVAEAAELPVPPGVPAMVVRDESHPLTAVGAGDEGDA